MALSPRLFALIGGIGGGCGLFPLILKETNNFSLSKTQSSSAVIPSISAQESDVSSNAIASSPEQTTFAPTEITSPQQSTAPTIAEEVLGEETNCKVIEQLDDIFFDLGANVDIYFTISCENTDKNSDDERMKGKWTILIPNTLLLDRNSLQTNPNLAIKTTTTSLGGEKRKTIFEGRRFPNNYITGEWEISSPFPTNEGDVITVTIVDGSDKTNPIYFVFPKKI